MDSLSPPGKKKKTSTMWEFFEKKTDRLILCKLCLKEFKYSNNTSNMKDHMVRKHPDYLLPPCCSENKEENNQQNTSTENVSVSAAQFYSANSSRKKYLDSMFVKMIAKDLQPLRLAEHEGMREFVKALDSKYQLPSRSVISNNLLPKLYTNLKLQLFQLLKDVKNIAVTTDMWTSANNQGVCAITIHFIRKQTLQSALLEAVVLEGSHNADNIATVLDKVLHEWNCRNKVVALVTDNAATMVKTAEILKVRHIPCFAHSLNLVMKDVLSAPGLKELVEKCSRIVTHFKHSTLASDKLRSVQREMNKPELKLIKFVETRWNSAFYMLKRILEVRQELTLVLNEHPSAPENLTAMEYAYLEEIEKIFEPLETCTNGISGDEYVTISLIIPLIKGLSLKMVELELQCNSDFAKGIMECLKTSVQKKLKLYESRSPCMISTLLNPHFKRLGFKTHSDTEKAITLVKKEYATYLSSLTSRTISTETPESTSEVSQETVNPPPAKKSKLSCLLSFLDNQHGSNATSVTADVIIDMRQYLEKPTLPFSEYPIEYWYYQESQLKHIALKYLCIPGSSTPSERVFSKAGLLITNRRNRLNAKHINELLFININQKLF